MELSNEELDSILARAGLKLAQPYHPSGEYRNDDYLLTSCVRCGVEAHYKLKYIRHKNKIGERVCRACYWLAWYGSARRLYDRGVQKLIERGYSRRELMEQGVLREKRGVDWGGSRAAREPTWVRTRGLVARRSYGRRRTGSALQSVWTAAS